MTSHSCSGAVLVEEDILVFALGIPARSWKGSRWSCCGAVHGVRSRFNLDDEDEVMEEVQERRSTEGRTASIYDGGVWLGGGARGS